MQHNPQRLARQLQGAKLYAMADRSDPFTYRRAASHTYFGICNPLKDGSDGHYKAEQFSEERRLPDGTVYHVPVYRNIQRP